MTSPPPPPAKAPAPGARCPICGKPPRAESRPFCSPRCAQIDLGRWFGEQYRVPVQPGRDDGEEAPEAG